jgi:hypothetical protein
MKGSLPAQLLEVFERADVAELVTVDRGSHPVVWPLAPRYHPEEGCIDVTVVRGDVDQAGDMADDAHVALLFSQAAPMVLVQGTAGIEEAGAEVEVHVRPERIYVWAGADLETEPELYDAHVDEVRSAHNEEPEVGHASAEGGASAWDARIDALGTAHPTVVLAFVGPDGFPFAVRVPVSADRAAGVVRIDADPVGAPIEPGLACLCAHVGRGCFDVLGDLEEAGGRWFLRPHRVVGDGGRAAEHAAPGR